MRSRGLQADIALLDEASWLLGPLRSRASTEHRSYGHIVVDEVQDLSPMELRMVGQAVAVWLHDPGRRHRSGDRAMGAGVLGRADGPPAGPARLAPGQPFGELPGACRGDGTGGACPRRGPARGHAARARAPDRTGARGSLYAGTQRRSGRRRRSGTRSISRTVDEERQCRFRHRGAARTAAWASWSRQRSLADIRSALVEGGVAFGEVGAGALDTPVSLLALGDAKGLEFDSVVVVEPARIVAQPPEGMRALYVALTRCTRRLAIVHREPLPAPLRGADRGARTRRRLNDGPDARDAGTNLEGVGHPGNGAGEES